MGRAAPRRAAHGLRAALDRAAPRTELAAAQTAWRQSVGEAISAVSEPVAERDGVLTVRCRDAVWAQELAMMESELLGRLAERLPGSGPTALKFLAG